jgi:hypothetical protein
METRDGGRHGRRVAALGGGLGVALAAVGLWELVRQHAIVVPPLGDTLYRWVIFVGCATVATLCTVCTALITPKRTYYPLLRLIFLLTAFIYGTTAASQWFRSSPNPTVRMWTVGVAVLMLVMSTAFIIRRNRLPQWVSMDWKGSETAPVNAAELDHCVLTTLALVRHGAASPELVGQLLHACRDWERHERWKAHDLPQQYRDRRAARQAANAAREVVATEAAREEEEGTR